MSVKRVLWPVLGGLLFGFLYFSDVKQVFLPEDMTDSSFWNAVLLSFFWWFMTALVSRSLMAFFDRSFRFKTGKQPPQLLLDMVSFVIWLVSFALYLSAGLGIDLSAFSTPTSVTIAILGFSLRAMLMDLFSGIAMSIERPFDVGDWIKVEGYGSGRVTHTNWRVTKMVTLDQLEVVVPNNYLSTKIFTNYNRPDALFRDSINLTLGYDVTVHKAERILLGAAQHVEAVASLPKKPDTRIVNFTPQGVEWKLRFWLDNYEKSSDVTYQIQKNIARNLHFAGIEPPPEKHYVQMHDETQSEKPVDITHILRSIEIFKPLSDDEVALLAQAARKRLLLKGENAVMEHDTGDSLFIVAEGLMTVLMTQADQSVVEVANIISGKVFGEMSLLTGAPRSATVRAEVDSVVYEIQKKHFQILLQKRPDLVTKISQTVSDRQVANDLSLQKLKPQEIVEIKVSRARKLKDRISQFFNA